MMDDFEMVNLSDARANLADLVHRSAYGHERILLGKRGKPIAALISMEDIEKFQLLEDIHDAELAKKSLRETKGKWVNWDDIVKDMKKKKS